MDISATGTYLASAQNQFSWKRAWCSHITSFLPRQPHKEQGRDSQEKKLIEKIIEKLIEMEF